MPPRASRSTPKRPTRAALYPPDPDAPLVQRLTLDGAPVPHPRITQREIHASTRAARYLTWKAAAGWAARQAGIRRAGGPIQLTVRVELRNPSARRWDVVNVLKAVEDALSTIAYTDDHQIVDSHIYVAEDPKPADRVLITIARLR